MYRLAIRSELVAYHCHLIENSEKEEEEHPHNYLVELELSGRGLDQHNRLIDQSVINTSLEKVLNRYREKTLNELPEFSRKNPSLELFSSILCRALADEILGDTIHRVVVRLWENEHIWASYEVDY